MEKVIVWGAGRKGRGFLGDIFSSCARVVFVDREPELIRTLRQEKKYTLYQFPGRGEAYKKEVTGFEAFLDDEDQVEKEMVFADVVALCVYLEEMPAAVKRISRGLMRRWRENPHSPMDLIVGANSVCFGPKLEAMFLNELPEELGPWFQEKVGVVEALLRRTCVDPDPETAKREALSVRTNGFPELVLDARAAKISYPQCPKFKLSTNMHMEEVRKIYTYNLMHAVYAYRGGQKGYTYIYQCREDPEIEEAAQQAYRQSCQALQMEYQIREEEMREYEKTLQAYVVTPALEDQVQRTGYNPLRKLGRGERILGPALLCERHGLPMEGILETAAYALWYYHEKDPFSIEMREMIERKGIEAAVNQICQLEEHPHVCQSICFLYRGLAGRGRLI